MKSFFILSVIVTLFLIHAESARIGIIGIPFSGAEIGTFFSAVALFFLSPRLLPFGKAMRGAVRQSIVSPLHIGLMVLLVALVSSTIFAAFSAYAPCPLSSAGFARALGILKSWFVFPILFGWVIAHVSHENISREKILFIFLVSFLPLSFLSLLGWVFGVGVTYDNRLFGIFNSPNALAMHLTPALLLSWHFFRSGVRLGRHTAFSSSDTPLPRRTEPSRARTFNIVCVAPLRLASGSVGLLLALLLFLTESVSAWIASLLALFAYEFLRNRRALKRLVALSALFLILAGTLSISERNNSRFEHFFDPDSRSSFASRLMIWRSAQSMIADSPLFGIGPGNFGECYLAYQKHFPPYLEWSAPEPHNLVLAFWLGSGIFGLLSFFFLLGFWVYGISQTLKQRDPQPILFLLLAIMFAIFIHGIFDTPYWRSGLAYTFWIVFFLGIPPKIRSARVPR